MGKVKAETGLASVTSEPETLSGERGWCTTGEIEHHKLSKKEAAVQQLARAALARRDGWAGRGSRAAASERRRHHAHATASGGGRISRHAAPKARRGEATFRGGRGWEALLTLYRLKLCGPPPLRGVAGGGPPGGPAPAVELRHLHHLKFGRQLHNLSGVR
eukprot:scaffold111233_cov67-Phaeocystis_antarctica.AAC.1